MHRLVFACVVVFVVAGLSPSSARADDYELAEAYFQKQNFGTAYLVGLPLAQRGDPRAQFLVGLMSEYGLTPVTRDMREAARWYGRAAAAGHADAQFAMAQAHARGQGVRVDQQASIAWLQRAAENDHVQAMLNLARLLDAGSGIAQDRTSATAWVRRAAARGDAGAMRILAERLAAGIGSERDGVESEQWLAAAAEAGDVQAIVTLAERLTGKSEPPESLVEAHALYSRAEQLAENDKRKSLATRKAELTQRMTPADLAAATERFQAMKSKR
jgi:TPR repeat protein